MAKEEVVAAATREVEAPQEDVATVMAADTLKADGVDSIGGVELGSPEPRWHPLNSTFMARYTTPILDKRRSSRDQTLGNFRWDTYDTLKEISFLVV